MDSRSLRIGLLVLAFAGLLGCVGSKCPKGTEELAGACLPPEGADGGYEQSPSGVKGSEGMDQARGDGAKRDAGSAPPSSTTGRDASSTESSRDADVPRDNPSDDLSTPTDDPPSDDQTDPQTDATVPSAECDGHIPDVAFCTNDSLRVCTADGLFTDVTCDADQTCVDTDDGPLCDHNDCLDQNGGCDSLVECTNAYPTPVCGECPSPYLGDGSAGCLPVLTALEPSLGELDPAFDPATLDYRVNLPMTTTSAGLTATAVDDATVVINGSTTLSGHPWQNAALGIGANHVDLDVSRRGGLLAQGYNVDIRRGYHAAHLTSSDSVLSTSGIQSISTSGNTIVIGAPSARVPGTNPGTFLGNAGAVIVFVVDAAGVWHEQASLFGTSQNAQLGSSVAIDGDTLVAGAPGIQAAFVWQRTGSTWSVARPLTAAPDAGDDFGHAVAVYGNVIAVGAPGDDGVDNTRTDRGIVYMFARSATGFGAAGTISGPGANTYWSNFGRSLALSSDYTLVVGALQRAYVFTNDGSTWLQQADLEALKPDRNAAPYLQDYGASVAIDGNTIVVGEPGEFSGSHGINSTPALVLTATFDGHSCPCPKYGAAFVFERSSNVWRQVAYIKASNAYADDMFGNTVAIRGNRVLVSAVQELGTSTDVNAVPGPRAAASATKVQGAVYVYDKQPTGWRETAYIRANPTLDRNGLYGPVAFTPDGIAVGAIGVDIFR